MKNTGFKDHFSRHSSIYSNFRPSYPQTLIDHILSLCPEKKQAWDCATGNGQAAVALAPHFDHVIATDASDAQISEAKPSPQIEYRVMPAENSGLEDKSVDLITVAQAIHWFDHDHFFAEVDRVLKPGGILAVWAYRLFTISPEIEKHILHFYHEVLNGYWPEERKHIEDAYTNIRFPYPMIQTPEFSITTIWTPEQLSGYLSSWSATQKYLDAEGEDPVAPLMEKILPLLDKENHICWPLTVKVSQKPV